MFPRFGLVLMVNHACNLRCRYCYTGAKFARPMPAAVGRAAIDRAVASLDPGGTLELGFFGGEPLLEAGLVAALIGHACDRAAAAGARLRLGLTTNGTVADPAAWSLLTRPDLDLALSHDGLPEVHDRHRRTADGSGTSGTVVATMRRLQAAGKPFDVVLVVRPDTVASLPEGIEFLADLGVRRLQPSLDLWTDWTSADAEWLEEAIVRCARLWRRRLPELGIAWFDEKLARLARVPVSESARCGFGHGEVAVAPSGRLYPCERLIGADTEDNPMRLAGHALEGADFRMPAAPPPGRSAAACGSCVVASLCSTTCRCSNYVRTGDIGRPDGLLCLLDRVCLRETANVMKELQEAGAASRGQTVAC